MTRARCGGEPRARPLPGLGPGDALGAVLVPRQGPELLELGHGDDPVAVGRPVDGTVTIVAHRSEMGTGVRTSLPLIVAEDMEAEHISHEEEG